MNQLNQGVVVEKEHKSTYKYLQNFVKKHNKLPSERVFFTKIAKNHLSENKNYYTKLKKAKL